MGFPHLVFLDAEGDVLAVHKNARTVEGFRKTLAAVRQLLAARDAAAAGTPETALALLLARADLSPMTLEAFDAALAPLAAAADARRKDVDAVRTRLEIRSLFNGRRAQEGAEDTCYQIHKNGGTAAIAGLSDTDAQNFWFSVYQGAEERQDVSTCEEALAALRPLLSASDRGRMALSFFEERLAKMKTEKTAAPE